jgi:acarbose 7IV-phosphotransferase
MSKLLISGLINIETTLRVDGFPIHYAPVRYPFFGVGSSVAGVGFNVAKALTTLGDEARLLSFLGRDFSGKVVRNALKESGVSDRWALDALETTPQSVILYDQRGDRMINVDLKNAQELTYPADIYNDAVYGCDVAILCNINFSRPFLSHAKAEGKLVATDVHAISNLDDPYNHDFMAYADILFMSDANLPIAPEAWAQAVQERFRTPIIVIGMGEHGALLAVREHQHMGRVPAVFTRPIVNTIGAGDALFAAFLHYFVKTKNPYTALEKAMVFASHKIGATGAAEGFLTEGGVEDWLRHLKPYPLPKHT